MRTAPATASEQSSIVHGRGMHRRTWTAALWEVVFERLQSVSDLSIRLEQQNRYRRVEKERGVRCSPNHE